MAEHTSMTTIDTTKHESKQPLIPSTGERAPRYLIRDDVDSGNCGTAGPSVDEASGEMGLGNEAGLSVDQVSQLMREQDADLLESMHYASSQVSQYSPGGTPVLRPKDRSLPMENVPLLLMPLTSTSQLLMDGNEKSSHSRTTISLEGSNTKGAMEYADSLLRISELNPPVGLPAPENDDGRFRRLLSGEVRSIENDDSDEQEAGALALGGEEEEGGTTASPVSVAQEAAAAAEKNEKESGLAEQRRVREAIQFAEAVGEKISINRDELCIIEDNTEDGDSEGSDDDEACESKEILVVSALDSVQESAPSCPVGEEEKQTILPSHVDVHSAADISRRKSSKRPLWPFGVAGAEFLDHLPDGSDRTDFVYKGICANPPEITKRGIQRGNYAQLHRKAWLEVSDKYHRYGKNLRLYYRYWERLGFPTNQFFDWLDSKGEAAGMPLPNLDECPRTVLDSDTVLYISNPEVTDGYALEIEPKEDGRARMVDVDGEPVITGSEGWIFVLRDNIMYGAQKITSISGHSKQRFHHSSFFGGKAVASAGIIITDDMGYLTRLYPHSGHYRPSEAHMQRMLFFLHRKGVDLRTFEMDTQQFIHISRDKEAKAKKEGKAKEVKCVKDKDGEKKMKKVDSLHLEKAVNVACFLAHKAGFIGHGIFDKIHRIRKANVANVSEALVAVDEGGFWQKNDDEDLEAVAFGSERN